MGSEMCIRDRKTPGRVISGRVSKHEKQAKATKEQMAFEIWEDLTADDL